MKSEREWIAKLARSVVVDNVNMCRRERIDPESGEVLEFWTFELIAAASAYCAPTRLPGSFPATVDAAVRQQHLKTAPAEARPQ